MSEQAVQTRAVSGAGMSGAVIAVLALVSAVAPLAIDMYLPAFPAVASEFSTTASAVQLTLTAFMFGLAVGQLVIGPLSDRVGRRPLMLVGTFVFVLASAACALAPSIELLTLSRLAQGVGGAAGIVLARAVIADRAHGAAAAKLFSFMMIVAGVAPVAAPLVGGTLIGIIGWRGVFWVLAGLGVAMFIGVFALVVESLPPERRRTGGLSALAHDARHVLGNRVFVGYVLTFVFGFGTLFAYISASPFVLQGMLGLSPLMFSVVFAANAVGLVGLSALNARLVDRFDPRALLRVGIGILVIGSALLVIDAIVGPHLWPTLILFWCTVSGLGLVMANATTLALAEARAAAGTGSAVLGASQFGLAALVAPLVGLGGEGTAVPMAVTMLASAGVAAGALAISRRRQRA
ncbi:MAG TPA: multidrug effflux MFS transporter [Aldersonia sp.]